MTLVLDKALEKPNTWTLDGLLPSDNPEGFIYSTKNYSQFKLDRINRPVDQKHVLELVEAIKRRNRLKDNPILVSKEGDVLNGQHRLVAAMELKVPIFYKYSDDATIEDIAEETSLTKEWTPSDYMHHFCAMGNEHYIELKKFCDKYKFIPVSVAYRSMTGVSESGVKNVFQRGLFTVMRKDLSYRAAEYTLDYAQYAKFYKDATFYRTIVNLADNVNYDHKRMMEKLSYQGTKLVRCTDVKAYIILLNEIYNYRANKKILLELLMPNSQNRISHREKYNKN